MKYIVTDLYTTINCAYVAQYRIDSRRNEATNDMSRKDYYLWAAVADINSGAGLTTVQLCSYTGDQFTAIRVLGVVSDFLVDDSRSFINISDALVEQENR